MIVPSGRFSNSVRGLTHTMRCRRRGPYRSLQFQRGFARAPLVSVLSCEDEAGRIRCFGPGGPPLESRLGEPLKRLQVPPEVVSPIVSTLREDQKRSVSEVSAKRARLEAQLTGIRSRMDAAYLDKLDPKIPEDFWERKMGEWRMEEQQVKMATQGFTHAETGDRCPGYPKDFRIRE
jgi:hypothetical protein